MAIRKEQALLLVVVALAALQYRSIRNAAGGAPRAYAPRRLEHQAQEPSSALLVDFDRAPTIPERDLFREPSETQPLPPRALEFPGRGPLTVLPLPLGVGPDAGHRHLQRVAGERSPEPVVFAVTEAEDTAPLDDGSLPEDTGSQDPTSDRERWARIYDQVQVVARGTALGILEHPDKLALEARTSWDGTVIRIRLFSPTRERLDQKVTEFPGEQVQNITLAKTLRNEVERRKRAVPETAATLYDRGKLIEWMLQKARVESWVYQEAIDQADLIIALTNGDLSGYRWKARVDYQKGDLAAVYRLFEELPQRWKDSSFRYEGLGLLKARLGLDVDAEADLQKAVEIAPTDPSARASLALFLLDRQRPQQALPHAEAAWRYAGRLPTDEERFRAMASRVQALLALGRFDDADALLPELPSLKRLAYLRGVTAFAKGDFEVARTAFDEAAEPEGDLEPLLGRGSSLLALGQWPEAKTSLEVLAQEAPLLRHRAYTGLALLYERTHNREDALAALDRALEANPIDPYAHYLRGHILRLGGDLTAAQESLDAALRLRDDLLHALAEMALCQLAQAEEIVGSGAGNRDAAESLVRAVRYVDRLVELEARNGPQSLEFLELQGLIHFRAADMRGARRAFEAGRALPGSEEDKLFCRVGTALVDYAQGRVEEARHQLLRLRGDLPPGHRYREYAEQTVEQIDDHAQKEMLLDGFERDELGDIWIEERDGELHPRIVDGALVFRGRFGRNGESWAQRLGAIEQAGRFLAVRVKMRTGSGHEDLESLAGLRLQSQPTAQRTLDPDFLVDFGLREGQPFLQIRDGRAAGPDRELQREPVRDLAQVIPDFDPQAEQTLELRVVPRDEAGQQLRLLAIWNGTVVHERDLTWLRRPTRNELMTMLRVTGRSGAGVDVSFDDYRLERRRDG